jgi:hypothetical protein
MKRSRISLFIVAVAALAACSDGGTGPSTPIATVASSVEANAANGQTALPGTAVASAPAVVVKDANGKGVKGVTVRFVVVQGGGSVTTSTAVTDVQGLASAGGWTLGSALGVNIVDAIVNNLTPVRFTATAATEATPLPPVSTGSFNITTRYVAGATTRQREAVDKAVARWQTVITGDLANVPVNAPAGTCFTAQPTVNEVVDDILIFVEFVDIDGAGKTLGQAGPCYIRTDNSLPVVGHLKLDQSDLQQMESIGTIDDVVLHEIGHVLGIGTLWPTKNLLAGAGTVDPQFTGTFGIAAYQSLGGLDAAVPVEGTGESGTKEGHWRESVFGNELMTGWISGTVNPLSRLTIASLQDLGYGANSSAASTFQLSGVSAGSLSAPIDLGKHEQVVAPRYRIDRNGRATPVTQLGRAFDTP